MDGQHRYNYGQYRKFNDQTEEQKGTIMILARTLLLFSFLYDLDHTLSLFLNHSDRMAALLMDHIALKFIYMPISSFKCYH